MERDVSSQSGFTLIEMMMALAVLSIAGLALMNMTRETTRNTGAVEARALAMIAAENILSTQWLEPGPARTRSGEYVLAGTTYDWSLEVSPTDDAGLVRLHLDLRDSDGRRAAELDTFRRAR